MTLIRHRVLHWLTGLFLALVLATPVLAQAPITFQYFYDELGQLTKVVDSAGNVIEYVYDPVGNILEIKRSTISGLSVFGFSPEHGAIGTTVMIRGQGFSGTPSDNTVAFKGVPTTVTSATTTTLVVMCHPGRPRGGGGSGGSLRLMAFSIAGGGTLNALGNPTSAGNGGSQGRVRLEAFEQKFTGKTNASLVLGSPMLPFFRQINPWCLLRA